MNGLLKRALDSGNYLEMIYLSDKGEITQRIVKIEGIHSETITAFCLLRNRKRTFKISNILSIGPVRSHKQMGA